MPSSENNYPGAASLIQDIGMHFSPSFILPLQNPEINIDEKLERVSEEEIYKLQQEQTASRKELAKKRAELFAIRGLGFPDFLDIIDDT
ncbi:unnamed protein product [Schistosoma margrebowiei]|uniref:Uncharacterized protein n=1 Tax=Schistosoma margrebowiei TaxID=48269 RepID=A0A183MYF6_9TREM|nr:unnamed protein product [Schistosoma margrebowiei]